MIESMNTLSEYHNIPRGELLELLIDTLQAMEQTRERQG